MFWESIAGPWLTMIGLFCVVGLGITLISSDDTLLTRANWRMLLGVFLLIVAVAFFFASFAYAVDQGAVQ